MATSGQLTARGPRAAGAAAAASRALPAPCARAGLLRPSRACVRLRASVPPAGSEFEGVGGDPALQESLVQVLRAQVESQALKEEIKDDLRERVEGLKAIGEELMSQLDEELSIEKFRTELESSQVLSEANEKLNELEAQVQQIKNQIKADQADLRAFESASATARSQGLFFRNLYGQPDADEGGDGAAGGGGAGADARGAGRACSALLDPAGARAAAAAVTASAEGEVGSPFRMYLFAYMGLVLGLVVAQDLLTPAPRLALDALYGALGLLLGANAVNERTALLALSAKQSAAAAEAAATQERAAAGGEADGPQGEGDGR
ncbi:hypothetical protein HT031_001721 [Scenedesmus sp. PABB004]|nr:hypothetical protein HT031_001721 [Scenedesmus sp. PABB004]